MATFYQFLMNVYGNNTGKVECILGYLKSETDFVERYSTMDNAELAFFIENASSNCENSALLTPLGIAIILSAIFLVVAIFWIIFCTIFKKK